MYFGFNEENVYNYALKQAWLEEYTKTVNIDEDYITANFSSVFISASKIEERLGKDLSSFTLVEIKSLLKFFANGSIASIRNRASLFRKYTDYAIANNFSVDGQNHYNELTLDDYRECVDKIRAEKGLFDYDEIRDMLEVFGNNARDQYLILAPWEGICGTGFKEIINLSLDDLDVDNNIVKLCTGRTIKVSPELMDIMVDAGNQNYYVSSEGSKRPLQPSKLIFKPLASRSATPVDNVVLTRRMVRFKQALDTPKLGYNMLRISGFCYYLAQLCNSKKATPMTLHTSKDQDYLALIQKYSFEKKSITEINYMYDSYIGIIPSVNVVNA